MNLKEVLLAELQQQMPTLGRISALRLADSIIAKADQFFPRRTTLRPGQLKWPAVRLTDGPGKRIEHTAFYPVTLDLAPEPPSSAAVRRQQRGRLAVALFQQARAQGALLTTEDVAAILCTCRQMVAWYVQDYQRTNDTVVPTRATVHDIGPGITHRLIICEKLLVQGRSVQQTVQDTHHSVRAVTRYLKGFTRVRFCLAAGMSIEQTAYLTGMSADLVRKYRELHLRLPKSAGAVGSLDTQHSGGLE